MSDVAPFPQSFSIEVLASHHLPGVLAALTEAHGAGFDEPWFDWKHRRNPVSPSPGWVAVDDEGVIGVRLFLPWRFARERNTLRALRPCDTVTVVRARGRKVFQALTTHALREVGRAADLIFNTPNSQSLPGYLKMGFSPWTAVRQYVGVAPIRRAALIRDRTALPGQLSRGAMSTVADRAFLEWRYEQIPHRTYEVAALANASAPAGAIYRMRAWRGIRLLVLAEVWGEGRDLRALLGALAWQERAPLLRIAAGKTFLPLLRAEGKATTVTHKPLTPTSPLPPPQLSIGDIEDVL